MSFVDAVSSLVHFRSDPVGFVRHCIGAEPQAWQEVALRAVADEGTDRLAIKACRGPGKTAVDAWLLWWFLACFYPARVPCTAPTKHQLDDKLWPECRVWMEKSKIKLGHHFEWQAQRILLREAPQLHFAACRVANVTQTAAGAEAYGLQGFHSENLLAIIDEASGVPRPVYTALEGARSTGRIVKMVATGNPNVPAGWFYEAFTVAKTLWRTMTISYKDTTLVRKKWALEMIDHYGIDNPFVMVHVLGLFPHGVEGGLIPLRDWEPALGNKQRELVRDGFTHRTRKVLSVDVANSGNNLSVIGYSEGKQFRKMEKFSGQKTEQLAEKIKFRINDYKPDIVVIDGDGIGAAVCDIIESWLSRERIRISFIRWRGNHPPLQDDRYYNLRAEAGHAIAEALQREELSVCKDSNLQAQATTIKIDYRKGKLLLENKKEFTKRIKNLGGSRSCDEFDAFLMGLAPTLLGFDTLTPAIVVPESVRTDSRRRRIEDKMIM